MIRVIGFYLILFCTHIVQALAGFGGTMLAMTPSCMLVGAGTAKSVLNMVAILMCITIVVKEYKRVNVKELIKITVVMLIGMAVGMKIYESYPLPLLLKFYGVTIILIAIKNLFFTKETGGDVQEEPMSLPKRAGMLLVLAAAGIIHGMFISGGSLLVVYTSKVLKDKGEFRATTSALWIVLDGILAITQIRGGLYTKTNMIMMAVAVIPLVISLWIGNLIHEKVDRKQFLKLTYVLLIISGSISFLS